MSQYADGVRPSNSSGIGHMLRPPAGDPEMRPAGPPSHHLAQEWVHSLRPERDIDEFQDAES
eukprot:2526766-Karenia_brevis.AAC.1